MENKEISPTQYFETIKDKKNKNTHEDLDKFYDASLVLLEKYRKTNQIEMMKKLLFIIDCIPKEYELIKHGIDIFIYKDDIEEYINKVQNKVVKIIELERYPREIPDELVSVIEETRDIFNNFYVLFTDYNGKVERQIEKERREKDPILFGIFSKDNTMNDRFYYLGDWIDEYCDLTLEKLLKEQGTKISRNISIPHDKDELIEKCKQLVNDPKKTGNYIINNDNLSMSFKDGKVVVSNNKTKTNIFAKITSVFKK